MTCYFVSRHAGAVEWARAQGLAVDHWVPHLDVGTLRAGDQVLGSLPVHLAAEVCALGAAYWHLSFAQSASLRGTELAAQALQGLGARLERFHVAPVDAQPLRLQGATAL